MCIRDSAEIIRAAGLRLHMLAGLPDARDDQDENRRRIRQHAVDLHLSLIHISFAGASAASCPAAACVLHRAARGLCWMSARAFVHRSGSVFAALRCKAACLKPCCRNTSRPLGSVCKSAVSYTHLDVYKRQIIDNNCM